MGSTEEQLQEQNQNHCFRSVEKAQVMAMEQFGLNTAHSAAAATPQRAVHPDNNNYDNNVFGKISASYPPTFKGTSEHNSFNKWFCNDNATMDGGDCIPPVSSKASELSNPLMCAEVHSEQPVLISETVIDLAEPTQLTASANQSMDAGYSSGMDTTDHHTMGLNISTSVDTYSYVQPNPICYASHFL